MAKGSLIFLKLTLILERQLEACWFIPCELKVVNWKTKPDTLVYVPYCKGDFITPWLQVGYKFHFIKVSHLEHKCTIFKAISSGKSLSALPLIRKPIFFLLLMI